MIVDDLDLDPTTYEEAVSDINFKCWIEAMKLESMYSNAIWTLMDLLQGIKPLGYKWIYKRKIGADGKVKTFKARLVEKGYDKQRNRL